jgi:uncharacterized coiled-coil protein SlyX
MKRITILTFVVFCFVPTARPQSTSNNGIRQLVTELQTEVAQLQVTVQAQATTIDALQNKLAEQNQELAQLTATVGSHEEKLRFVSVKDTEMFITGANLNIRDGSGFTSGTPGTTPNGLGNLIIGYNECPACPPASRSGSHNLVLGENNRYTSFGGIVASLGNSIAGPYATITGGGHSISSGLFSTVTGGTGNKVTAQSSSISGGGFVIVNTQFSWAAAALVSPKPFGNTLT